MNYPSNPSHQNPVRFVVAVVMATAALLGMTLLAGCNSSARVANQANSKPLIVTTTGMVRDMVSALVGPDATVHAIMGAGVDPHLYQPSRGDSVKILQADVVVYNGLHLEGRLGEVLESRSKQDAATVSVGDTLPAESLLDADAGLHDPHIWMDVTLWSQAMMNVAEELAAALPQHADSIHQRAAAYQDELSKLDAEGAAAINSIPESQRVLVTAHDAFRYFGKRYGVEVHGVQGVSTISDAAISDVNRLVDLIVRKNVPAVFFESSVSPRQVKAIVEGARRKGLEVSSDSTLLSDSMGADGTPSGTYIGMMRHNFHTIATALGGEIPDMNHVSESVEGESDAEQTSVPEASGVQG